MKWSLYAFCELTDNIYQEVEQKYEKWSADRTTLEISFDGSSIELDQQEQEVGSWSILPLTQPPKVFTQVLCRSEPDCDHGCAFCLVVVLCVCMCFRKISLILDVYTIMLSYTSVML